MQAYVSRTEYPKWATQCLKLLQASPAVTMHAAAEFQVNQSVLAAGHINEDV